MNDFSANDRVSIIGAGIMGLSAACALSQKGFKVAVFDAGHQDGNASAVAGGMLAPYSEIEYLPAAYHQAARDAIAFWKRNAPGNFTQNGTLIVAHKEDQHLLARFGSKAQELPACKIISREDIAALEPGLTHFNHGFYMEGEAHLDTPQTLETLKKQLPPIIVQDFNIAENNGWIIDCRGYGAATDEPELRGVKGEAILVRNRDFTLQRPVRLMHPRYPLYIVPRADNIFMIGATTIESAGHGEMNMKSALELMSAAYSLHPSFADSEIIALHAGIRPAYPDNLPRITVKDKIIRCNGLFRHGFLLAPVMAECVAGILEKNTAPFTDLFLYEGKHHDHHAQRPKNYVAGRI